MKISPVLCREVVVQRLGGTTAALLPRRRGTCEVLTGSIGQRA